MSFMEKKQPKSAIPFFKKIAKQDPKNTDALYNHGIALNQLKKYQDAMKKGAAPKKRTQVQTQPSIVKSSKGTLVKKNSIGVNDFRKGGLTLSVTDNKKKKK